MMDKEGSQTLMKTLSNHFKVVAITAGVFSYVLGAGAQEPGAQVRKTYDLQGRITDISGKPLKDAHVFIYTAMPKEGPAYLCLSPQYCDGCGEFLENDLTPEGNDFVLQAVATWLASGIGDDVGVKSWIEFYDVELAELVHRADGHTKNPFA